MDFQGTYTAMVTPFRDRVLDIEAYRELLNRQRSARVAGVVPCGCTGEAATLDENERKRLLSTALEAVGDSMQVVPGTGSNSTETAIALTKTAEIEGAHAAMLITPYYNKPSQEGLVKHYTRIADATTIPLVLYNVPSRTGVTLAAETVAELYSTGRFAAIKEAGGRVDAVSDFLSKSSIVVLSGDDSLTVPMMSIGAKGVVSVVSNLFPGAVREMVDFALEGNFKRASEIHFQLLPVIRAAFVESNPSPIKAMLATRGLIANELRAPLAPVSETSMTVVHRALETAEKVVSS
ncbi:MAG: 4-hydroxy-tetrahydrodipicolinate synthase [Candidatus Latescibacterota bacterium]|nr:MAG: 4-hydroxy-tetrahydrodipicolinate synthase [Candidatus Latescibacterota bacterium]